MHLQAPYATLTNHCTCIDMRVGESIGRGSPGTVFSSSLSSSSSEVKLYGPSEDSRASCQTAGTPHVQFVFLRLCLLAGAARTPQAELPRDWMSDLSGLVRTVGVLAVGNSEGFLLFCL